MIDEFSYLERLENKLPEIESIVDSMLNNSSIYPDRGGPSYITFRPYLWGEKDPKNHISAKEKYLSFYNSFSLLIEKANPEKIKKIEKANKQIINLIDQDKAPSSIEKGKENFRESAQVFITFLNLLKTENKKTIILPDTNSIISFPEPIDYKSIAQSKKFEFVILPTVLAELDKHKMTHRNDDFRKKVTSVIKRLKGYRKQGNLLSGVIVHKNITVKMIATEPDFGKTLGWLDSGNNDDRIIANALDLQVSHPGDTVILVTADLNLQNKAEMANLTAYDTDDLSLSQ